MKERNLHSLFSRLVILAAPLAAQTGCGGTTAAHNGGVGPDGGGIGGAIAGGAAGLGGAAAGAGTGGAATGGSAPSGAGTGGSSACVIPTIPSADCTLRRSGTIPRSCVTGDVTSADCQAICGNATTGECQTLRETDTTITISCPPACIAGRRPAGFIGGTDFGTGLGAYFARAAQLEGASVAAFRGLRAELHALGAPRPLLRALSRAARDEQRHTRATSALARRFGARSLSARVAPVAQRSLEAITLENVAEGCVRELYGALVATFQARTAQDLQVRSAMARIAARRRGMRRSASHCSAGSSNDSIAARWPVLLRLGVLRRTAFVWKSNANRSCPRRAGRATHRTSSAVVVRFPLDDLVWASRER